MLTQKYICILTFTTALFTIAKTWKQPEPIDRCMEKDDVIHTHTHTQAYVYIYVYTYNGILFTHKKEGNPAICDNMDGP